MKSATDNRIEKLEKIEVEFWRNDPDERPGSNSLENLTNKMSEARVLLEKLQRYGPLFAASRLILELGAGQAWGSCIVKRLWPTSRVLASDISPEAVTSVEAWAQRLGARPDAVLASKAYQIPIASCSVDLVWCFAAAHHFRAHRRAIFEVSRILKPKGHCLYLHEPSCRPAFYAAAHRRVNRKRPEVPEDVLRYPEILALSAKAGLRARALTDPTTTNRTPREAAYYSILAKSKFLASALPCTRDFVFEKPGRDGA